MTDLAQIAVIGSGLMGHGIAQVFAVAGHPVAVVDSNEAALDSVKARIRANLTTMTEHGIALQDDLETILDRVRLATDMVDGCQDAGFVTEAVFENMALKQEIFAQLDQICPPETVLCSNTSVMSITEIASKSQRRERIIGTHWWNPPHLIPLVEIVRTEEAADWCIEAVHDLLQGVGKRPVRVERDVPGFVGNRLQHALWREAFFLIDEGICDVATVDEVIRSGFGLRLPVLGPVENADMVGLDLVLAIQDYIFPHLNAAPTPSATLRDRVKQGALGFKSGRGFLEWSEAEATASRQQLANYLLSVLARQQNEA